LDLLVPSAKLIPGSLATSLARTLLLLLRMELLFLALLPMLDRVTCKFISIEIDFGLI
jgi:hypothetical protein